MCIRDRLSAPKLRGSLGEFFLDDLLSQILPKEHYTLQYKFKSGETVDAVIHLAQGLVPVDSKFPLENFRRLIESQSDIDKKTVKKKFVSDVKKHIDNGRKLFEAGNYKEAIKEFKQAIAIDKNLEDSYNFLSAAYTKIGRLEDACKTFQKLINLQPKNHTAHYNLGVIYHRMGMYDEELSEYKKALKFQPDYSPALYNMGIWYGNNGMYDEAVDAFEKLVAVDPNNVQARYYLAIAFMKKNQYDEARFQFSKAVEIDPKFESARQGLKAVEKLTDKKEINKERLRLSHILVSTRSEAEKILRLLKQGQSFAELAKRKSIDRTSGVKGGDLGFFEKGDLLPELEDVVFNLKVGQISGIVKSRLGYHIFKRTK